MKPRLLFIFAVLALLLTAAPAFSQDQVTLHVMHWTDNMVPGTPWWDEIIKGFQDAHPGVTVETNFVSFDQYLTTLAAMTAGDTLPDVFFGHVKVAELGRSGLTVDFKDVFPPEFFDQFYPGPLRQFTFDDGKVYALPWTAQMLGIFVNKTVMDELKLEPPNTWDDLIAMTPAIKDAGYIPLAWGNAEGSNCPDFVLPLITQYGGDVYKLDDLTDPDVSWDSEPVVNALTLLQKLAQAGVFVDGINGMTDPQATQLVYQDRAAMFFSGSWMPGTIATEAPPEFADTYFVSKEPALTADGVHWSGDGSGDGWVLSAHSPNYDLAVEFLKYLFSPDTYAIHIRGSQNMPSMPSALQYVDNPVVKEMTGWLDTDGTDHILFGQGSWDAVANVCSAILDSSMTPTDGAAQIQADVLATRKRS